jgi:hypothetical protein
MVNLKGGTMKFSHWLRDWLRLRSEPDEEPNWFRDWLRDLLRLRSEPDEKPNWFRDWLRDWLRLEEPTEQDSEPAWTKPAATNLWYLLATIHGTQSGDPELQTKNRRAWNRFMSRWLDQAQREKLYQSDGPYSVTELNPLSDDELDQVRNHLIERGANSKDVSDLSSFLSWSKTLISLDYIIFDKNVDFTNYIFSRSFNCAGSHFRDDARFNGAIFLSEANFMGTHFHSFTRFDDVKFYGKAVFESAKFLYPERSGFEGALFHKEAEFQKAIFKGPILFDNVKFSNITSFTTAKFLFKGQLPGGAIRFVNCKFKNQTSFECAEFPHSAPLFFGAKLHEGTAWQGIKWPLPKDSSQADLFLRAYERLKLEMDRVKKHEDELNFFTLELKCKKIQKGSFKGFPITLYGWLCKHGQSYFRPMAWLVLSILIGTVPLWIYLGWTHWARPLTISIANTFSILGVRREFVSADFLQKLPGIIRAFGALQSVVGLVLLFCFGLAIRNQFRLK